MHRAVHYIVTLAALVAVASCASSGGGVEGAAAGLPAKPETQFLVLCARCHQPELIGQKPSRLIPSPRIAAGADLAGRDLAYLEAVVRGGGAAVGKSRLMPAFAAQLDPAATRDLIAWMRGR